VNASFEIFFFYCLVALHVLFSMAIETACFEWEPFSEHFASCYTPLPTIVTSWLKALKVILFSLFDVREDIESLIILCCIAAVSGFLSTVLFLYYLPFYNPKTNIVYVFGYAFCTSAALASLFGPVLGNPLDQTPFWTFIVIGSLLFPSTLYLIHLRQGSVLSSDFGKIVSSVKFMLKVIGSQKTTGSRELHNTLIMDEKLTRVSVLYNTHQHRFKDSPSLQLAYACFLYMHEKKSLLAISTLKQLLLQSPSLLYRFVIHIRLRDFAQHDTSMSFLSAEVLLYEKCDKNERKVQACMVECAKAEVKLWTFLAKPHTDIRGIKPYIQLIEMNMQSCREGLLQLIALNPKNAYYRRLYAKYLWKWESDRARAEIQLARSRELEDFGMDQNQKSK
jgi:hypothetical protein